MQSPPLPSRPYRVVVGLTCGSVSGVDVFSFHLVRELRARGVDAHLLLSRPRLDWFPMALPGDVPSVRLDDDPRGGWRARWSRMIQYLHRQAPCVWLPNYDFEHSCVAPQLRNDVSIVGIVHSDAADHYEHAQRLGRYWNATVAVSAEIARKTALLDAALSPRLSTITYGVPTPGTARVHSDGPLRLVYAGRLDEEQKRVLALPEIMARLQALGVPAVLKVIGDGPLRGALENASRTLIAAGRMELTGILPNPEVLATFARSDVLLLPSAFEGLPMCLLEAMAHGAVPVVSDLRSGVPEVVDHGVNGVRVPTGDLDGFAREVAALQADRARLQHLSQAATDSIRQRHGVGGMAEAYLSLFDRVTEEAARGGFRRPPGPIVPHGSAYLTWSERLHPSLFRILQGARGAWRRHSPSA